MPPSVQTQRDNLEIGIYLYRGTYGNTLDNILQVALGYNPSSGRRVEVYERRFRTAQRAGREAFRRRTPGYFTFNAMPFGGQYIYKDTWYVRINAQTGQAQTVPLPVGDLASMQRLRARDRDTRKETSRSVDTAHNIEEQRQALKRQDWASLQEINGRMIEDESLGEILSGFHGLPYVDIQNVIDKLPSQHAIFRFQKDAKQIRQLDRRLRQAYMSLGRQLTNWVMLQTGVPSNAPQAALKQAQQRLDQL